ncbi:tetratricopeptide repeat protein [Zavarzinella formosa]|uniref:tetratricopeptide repeat protein n=1 Tax=Zavarzinella formosa TaxID=360055 RepID=UPI0002F14A3E|nr:hypothetical protein [Zavarzinella formosa]
MRRTLIGCGLFAAACLLVIQAPQAAEVADSAGAKMTREKRLPVKMKLDIEKKMLRAIINDDLPAAFKEAAGLPLKIDVFPGTGVTLTSSFELKGEMTLAEALDKLCADKNWGWFVHSAKPGDQKDGMIYLTTNGKEHGYKDGTAPGGKDTKEAKKETGKKEEMKKEEVKKDAPPANDTDKAAAALYDKAKLASATGKKDMARKLLTELLEKYPDSAVAADAKKSLEKLGK